jgi:hypothetical protein
VERQDLRAIDCAVLIGGSEFLDKESFPDLPAVKRNVASLQHLFMTRRFGLAANTVKIPPSLTMQQYAAFITEIVGAEPPPSGPFFYFAGHGVVLDHEEELYLIVDTATTRANVRDFGLRASDVLRKIDKSNAALRVVVLDCCDAARGLESVLKKYVPPIKGQRSGTYAVASSTRDVSAFAPLDAAHTAFSAVLIDVLDNGLDNGRPYLDLDEIFRTVESRIEESGLPTMQILTALKGNPSPFAWNAYYPTATWRTGLAAEAMIGMYAEIERALQMLEGLRGEAPQTQLEQTRDLISRTSRLFDSLRIATEAGDGQWSAEAMEDLGIAIASAEDNADRYLSTGKAGRRRRRRIEERNSLAYSLRQMDEDTAVLVERKRALLTSLDDMREALRAVSRTSP